MNSNKSTVLIPGYAGLIPFVFFSFASWITLPFISDAAEIVITYGAIILSFMGAIHWGLAISNINDVNRMSLIVSVTPALLAWIALLLAHQYALIILLLGFISLLLYDFYTKSFLICQPGTFQ